MFSLIRRVTEELDLEQEGQFGPWPGCRSITQRTGLAPWEDGAIQGCEDGRMNGMEKLALYAMMERNGRFQSLNT